MEKLNYIHQNPVRAGLVGKASDYRWSSARIWQGRQSENKPLVIDKDVIHWRQASRRGQGRARTRGGARFKRLNGAAGRSPRLTSGGEAVTKRASN